LDSLALLCTTVIFRLGGDRAKSQPLNASMRPRCQVGPKQEKVIFELGGTGRGVPAHAGVLLVATTPRPELQAARRRRALPLTVYE
jgi:hypothetical protein